MLQSVNGSETSCDIFIRARLGGLRVSDRRFRRSSWPIIPTKVATSLLRGWLERRLMKGNRAYGLSFATL
ncbi:hypothetical protein VTK56DRAFT_50 [Thermocarpiscus australiensis]